MIPRRPRPTTYPRISRRGLITSGVLAGVLAATGVSLQAQTRGGHLRLALSGARPTDSWDPTTHRSIFMRVLSQGAVRDCLTEISATGELNGELAQSWETTPDARVWTFTLRRDVAFHDGTPLTPQDVIASLDWHRDRPSPATAIIDQIATLRSPGPGIVEIALTGPNVDFPILLSDPHLTIAPAGRMTDPIGTGLYQVIDFTPGESARLARVTQHYKDGRAGWFDTVTLTAATATVGADIDATDMTAGLMPTRDTVIRHDQGSAQLILQLPTGTDPALAAMLPRAIDRQAVIDTLLNGQGLAAQDHPLGLANAGLRPLPPMEPDADLARWIMARTGADPLTGQGLVPRRTSGRLTDDWAFSAAIGPGGAWESQLGRDSDVRHAIATARNTFDSTLRTALHADLQAIFAAQGHVAVAAHLPWSVAHSTRLRHPDALGTTLPLDGGRIAERWWFA